MLDTSLLTQHRSTRRTEAMTRTTATLIAGEAVFAAGIASGAS